MMLDPFAAALGDESDGKFVASARMCRDKKAHSQDSINEHKLAAIAIDDDGSDHAPVDEAAMQGAEPLVALQASERERPTAKTATPEMKRRRIDLNQKLKLTPIEEKNGSSVVCLFVPRAKVRSTAAASEAIPLWPQYTAFWRDADFGHSTWLILSNYERWVMRLVDAVTHKSVRQVAKSMLDATRAEFVACLTKARSQGEENSSLDSDEELESPSDQSDSKPAKLEAPAIDIEIGGFPLTCMNLHKQVVLQVGEDTTRFIRYWLVPLAGTVAHSQVAVDSSKDSSLSDSSTCDTPSRPAGFQFTANPTPNIREKISWNPMKHAWKVNIQKPLAALEEKFEVDPLLTAAKYELE